MDDDRNDFAKAAFIKNILQQTGFRKFTYPVALFNRISDSTLKGDSVRLTSPLTRTTPLFSFSSDKTYTFGDWLAYLQTMKENGTPVPARGVEELYSRYIDNAATDYYGQHLERYNKEFAAQLNEFRDGNLLFEIMQKKIWDVAADDTAGLRKYYSANASKYWWSSSADVVVFTTSDEAIAELIARELPSASFDWRKFVQEHNESLQADSGRFELDQLPVSEGTKLMPGTLTAPMRNEIDNNLVFCLVLRMYPEKEQRNFSDARGFVINDYQNFLEDQWINTLRKKYPVKINEAVLRSLPQGEIK
jgi:peptidyl-prolyl cis-trans isomerase SurA